MGLLSKKDLDYDDISMRKKLGASGKAGMSKQNFVENKLFGNKRSKIRMGKKFNKHGKGIDKKPVSAKMHKASSISPSMEAFDKMMSSVVNKKVSKKSDT